MDYRFQDGIYTIDGIDNRHVKKLPEELVPIVKEKFDLDASPYLYVANTNKGVYLCNIDITKKKPVKCKTVRIEKKDE